VWVVAAGLFKQSRVRILYQGINQSFCRRNCSTKALLLIKICDAGPEEHLQSYKVKTSEKHNCNDMLSDIPWQKYNNNNSLQEPSVESRA